MVMIGSSSMGVHVGLGAGQRLRDAAATSPQMHHGVEDKHPVYPSNTTLSRNREVLCVECKLDDKEVSKVAGTVVETDHHNPLESDVVRSGSHQQEFWCLINGPHILPQCGDIDTVRQLGWILHLMTISH